MKEPQVKCSFCGNTKDKSPVITSQHNKEVGICFECAKKKKKELEDQS